MTPTLTPTPTATPGPLGDPDQDGVVTGGDVQLIFEYTIGLADLSPKQLYLADANQDGIVDANDIQCTFLISIGLTCDDVAPHAKSAGKRMPASTSAFFIAPRDVSIPPGQTGFVDVMVVSAPGVDSYTVDVIIDSSKLEFVSVSKDGTLSQDFTMFGGNVVSDGRGRVTGVALSASPISGDGILFRVELKSKDDAEGSAAVVIDNPQADLRGADVGSGTVSIAGARPHANTDRSEKLGSPRDWAPKPSRSVKRPVVVR
jgi:hypothetical protein